VPLVGASNTHLWLQPDLEVDLHAAAERARNVLDLPSLDASAVDVHRELSDYADDVLVGWYDEWVFAERERFRQLRLHVLDQLGELLLRAHRYSEAVQVGLVAVASEPLRESAHRLLVRAHLCEGNLAEALRQYRSYAELLARELRVRPSAAMEDLISAAVTGASSSAWSTEPRFPTARLGPATA
jgi:DNA-binding SARP family transcriptional activator